jgi:hypothetical protein
MPLVCDVQKALECGVDEIQEIYDIPVKKKQLLYYDRAHFKHSHIQMWPYLQKGCLHYQYICWICRKSLKN